MVAKRITTTRRAAPQPMVTSFEDNATRWNEDAEAYRAPASDTERKAASPDVEALQKRLAELETTNRELQTQRFAAPIMVTQPAPPAPPKPLSYDGLPDPVSDPEAYAKGLGDRLMAQQTAQNNYDRQVASYSANEAGAKDQLFEDFSEAYPEIAQDEDGVTFVTTKVLKRLQSRRINPDQYMFANSERFFNDVVKEYKKTFHVEDDNDDEPVRTQRTRQREDDDEPTRTGGIHGGNESGSRPPARTPPVSDLVSELKDIQRKSEFF